MTQEETENLQWRVASEIEVGEKCSHGHKNQYSERKQEKNILFLWLEHWLDICLENHRRREKVPSWNMVVTVLRGRGDLPWTHLVIPVTSPP